LIELPNQVKFKSLAFPARLSYLQYPAAGVATIAAYLGDLLIGSIPAVIAAIFLIPAGRTSTSFVPAFVVIVSHNISPVYASNFATGRRVRKTAALLLRRSLAIRNYKHPMPRETTKTWIDHRNAQLIGTLIEKTK
jgi:hypothetical protein